MRSTFKKNMATAVALLLFTFAKTQNVGVGTNTPNQKLDVTGKLKIGNDPIIPTAGTIRFNDALKDFEGFDGVEWKSLTASYTHSPMVNTAQYLELRGYAVSVYGNFIAVGSLGNEGSINIFRRTNNSWFYVQTLNPSTVPGGQFGSSVAMNENYLVVGAPYYSQGQEGSTGRVSLYKKINNQFVLLNHYRANTPVFGERFGGAVSLYGNYLAVSGRAISWTLPTNSNNVYVFTILNDGLQQQQIIVNPNNPAQEEFGIAIAIDSTTVAIGAPNAANFGNAQRGKVYLYKYAGANSFSYTGELGYAGYGNAGDHFGASLSLHKNNLVIGAPDFDIPPLTDMGAFFICKKNAQGIFESSGLTIYTHPFDTPGERFGQGVAIYNGIIVAGCTKAVYQYVADGAWQWGYHKNLSANFPAVASINGGPVALHELTYIIGDHSFNGNNGRWVAGDCRY